MVQCLRLPEDNREHIHIQGIQNTYETLCGFVDTPGEKEYFEGTPDCPSCLEIVRYCKKIRLPKNTQPKEK